MTVLDSPARKPHADGSAPGRRPAWSVVVALARIEARRLARHPALWIGVALGAVLLAPTLWPFRLVLPRESAMLQVAALPIALATLVAAHLATTRPRRDDVTELLGPGAHGEDTRTLALLLAVLAPTAVTATLVALALGGAATLGGVGPVWWAEAATAPALVAAGGATGVALGRLAPWRLAPLFGVVAIALAQIIFSETGGPGQARATELLAPIALPSAAPHDPAAMLRPAGLHLLYLVGVAAVAAAAAALVSRITALRTVALIVAGGVAFTAGLAQLRPPDDAQVQEVLARASDPVAAGECTTDDTSATVCTLPPTSGWHTGWAELVRAVRSPLTERGLELAPVTLAQRAAPSTVAYETSRWHDTEAAEVDQHLQTAWDNEYRTSDPTVLLTSEWPRGSEDTDPGRLDLALHAARQAVGLPVGFAYTHLDDTGSVESTTSCSPVGQAREAITIWLAARADPAAAGALRRAVAEQPYPGTAADPIDDGSGFADATAGLELSTGAIAGLAPEWSKPGAHVALQMLDGPGDALLDPIVADWDRWTDPSTPLRDLVQELDLTMPPLAADLQQQLGGGAVGDDLARSFRDTPLPAPDLDATGTAELDVDPIVTAAVHGCP